MGLPVGSALDHAQVAAAPAAPSAGTVREFAKNGRLYSQDSTGQYFLAGSVRELEPVVVAYAGGNATLSGTQTLDGVAAAAGDRVLLLSQTNILENGIWVVAAGAWTRAADADTAAKVARGTRVWSLAGGTTTTRKLTRFTQMGTVTTFATDAQHWRAVETSEMVDPFLYPPNPIIGQVIFDYVRGQQVVWDGTIWRATGGILVAPSTSYPSIPGTGSIYYETDTGQTKIYDGSAWKSIGTMAGLWQSYTPSTTSITLGTGGTVVGRYTQIGNTVHWRVLVTLGTGGQVVSAPTISLPVPATAPTFGEASGLFIDSGSAAYQSAVQYAASVVGMYVLGASGGYNAVGGTTPFTWTVNDQVWVAGTYETASASWGGVVDTGWTAPTFSNSWVNYGAPYGAAGYRRVGNVVYLRGLIKSGTVNLPAFTLPVGYRPATPLILNGVANSVTSGAASAGTAHTHGFPDIATRINVDVNGDVTVTQQTVVSNGYVSLDGLSFLNN